MDVRYGRSTERTSGRSIIIRITSTSDVQVRKIGAIETSNGRKCASRACLINRNCFQNEYTFLTSNSPLKRTKFMDPPNFCHSAMEHKNLKNTGLSSFLLRIHLCFQISNIIYRSGNMSS